MKCQVVLLAFAFLLVLDKITNVSSKLVVTGKSGNSKSWTGKGGETIQVSHSLHQATNAHISLQQWSQFVIDGSLTQKSGSYVSMFFFCQLNVQPRTGWTLEDNAAIIMEGQLSGIRTHGGYGDLTMRKHSMIKITGSWISWQAGSWINLQAHTDIGVSSTVQLGGSSFLGLGCGGTTCSIGTSSTVQVGNGCVYYAGGPFDVGNSCHLTTHNGARANQNGSLQLNTKSNLTLEAGSHLQSFTNSHLTVQGMSSLTMGAGSLFETATNARVAVGKKGNLTIGARSVLRLGRSSTLSLSSGENILEIQQFSMLDIGDRSMLTLGSRAAASITIRERALLKVLPSTTCLVIGAVVIHTATNVTLSPTGPSPKVTGFACFKGLKI